MNNNISCTGVTNIKSAAFHIPPFVVNELRTTQCVVKCSGCGAIVPKEDLYVILISTASIDDCTSGFILQIKCMGCGVTGAINSNSQLYESPSDFKS